MRTTTLRRLLAVVALLLAPLAQRPAWAWGDNGHIAVAKVADGLLTKTTRAKAKQLLGGKDIFARNVCMFADTFKHTQAGEHTKPWHFVDIPVDAGDEVYDATRDCQSDDCAVAQIANQTTILENKSLSKAKRAMALKFLLHFVGDIHQPLHAAERQGDQGGNKVPVTFLGGAGVTNLHAVWDNDVLDENLQGLDPEDYADQIRKKISPSQKSEWRQATDAETWANESHKAAVAKAYDGVPVPMSSGGAPFDLDAAYVDRAKPVVETQIQKAGVRLARLLTSALK